MNLFEIFGCLLSKVDRSLKVRYVLGERMQELSLPKVR